LQAEGIQQFTVRQLYYQLVARKVIESSWEDYKNFDKFLVVMRKNDPALDSMFIDPSKPRYELYSSSFWKGQKYFVEVWLEKQALQDFFMPYCKRYKINLVITKGYPSVTRLRDAKEARQVPPNVQFVVLYFGDFDPSGIDIERHINEELSQYGISVIRVALTERQVKQYALPSLKPKLTDTRTPKFVQKYGNVAVELDALHPKILKQLIRQSIMNYVALDRMLEAETEQAIEEQTEEIVETVLKDLKKRIREEARKMVESEIKSYVLAYRTGIITKLKNGEEINYASMLKNKNNIIFEIQRKLASS